MPEFSGSSENDIRFQYGVILQLSESVREMARTMASFQSTQIGMLERLVKIEANRVNEDVARVIVTVDGIDRRVDLLEKHDTYEDGMRGARKALIFYWPALAAIGCLILFLLVATGALVIPSTQKPPIIVGMSANAGKGNSP